ncbi:hypothetical protein VB776_06900 [Arcicella sp. DC2W]|uniref:Uncharacterized protein n=1 Tax=Arcicella gelida TaxID=2984195 RepID=A0ABU5S2L6_9BACT|nr:hypothetical protein [Arcicella sp. DC2W]MEA5402635.1 hypothetical protein [Arcicella sp. DC2W]
MSFLDKFKRATDTVKGAGNALKTAADAFGGISPNQHAYQGMMGNPTTSRGNDGQLRNYQYQQEQSRYEEEEEEVHYHHPEVIEREVSDALMASFRKRATVKTDMIILQLQRKYLYQKVLAKVIIQNKGDDETARTHQDIDDDEFSQLSKDIQKILRNQKHLRAIENFKIEDYFKESCIEYFVMEFEEDYRNGIAPDFKDINPIELMMMKMQEPFTQLVADYVVDYALDLKPKIIEGATALKTKYIDGAIKNITKNQESTDPKMVLMDIVNMEAQSNQSNVQNETEQVDDKDINDKWAESELKRNEEVVENTNPRIVFPQFTKGQVDFDNEKPENDLE